LAALAIPPASKPRANRTLKTILYKNKINIYEVLRGACVGLHRLCQLISGIVGMPKQRTYIRQNILTTYIRKG